MIPVPAPPEIETVAQHAARWAAELPRRWRAARPPHDDALLDRVVGVARELSAAGGDGPERALLRRLDALVDAAGLDGERARAWSLVRVVETVVWNAETGLIQREHRPGWLAEPLLRSWCQSTVSDVVDWPHDRCRPSTQGLSCSDGR